MKRALLVYIAVFTLAAGPLSPHVRRVQRLRLLELGPGRGGAIAETFKLDFNHDGRVDILAAGLDDRGRPSHLRLIENLGGGSFADVTEAKLGRIETIHARHLSSGDLDGDGVADFVVADTGYDRPPFSGAPPVLLMSRAGRLVDESASRLPRLSGFTFHTAVLDVDSDGDADIVLGNLEATGDPPGVLINDGHGRFRFVKKTWRHPVSGRELHMMSLAAGDFDGDGLTDLFLGGQDTPELRAEQASDVIAWGGRVEMTRLPSRPMAPDWGTVTAQAVDLDRDGDLDVVAAFHNFGFTRARLGVYVNEGHGRFSFKNIPIAENPGEKSFVVWLDYADFTGDGRADLLVSVRNSDLPGTPHRWPLRWLKGTPSALAFRELTGALPESLKAGSSLAHFIDTDGDGRPELVRVHPEGRIEVFGLR